MSNIISDRTYGLLIKSGLRPALGTARAAKVSLLIVKKNHRVVGFLSSRMITLGWILCKDFVRICI